MIIREYFLKMHLLDLTTILVFVLAKALSVDIGFVFGADGPKASKRFSEQKSFAKKLIDSLVISPAAALIGGILHDSSSRIAWRIGDAQDKDTTVGIIDQLQMNGLGNDIGKAVEISRSLFAEVNGARRKAEKILVIFLDETFKSNADLEKSVEQVKSSGVKVIVIASGTDVDEINMLALPSDSESLVKVHDLANPDDSVLPTFGNLLKPGIRLCSISAYKFVTVNKVCLIKLEKHTSNLFNDHL